MIFITNHHVVVFNMIIQLQAIYNVQVLTWLSMTILFNRRVIDVSVLFVFKQSLQNPLDINQRSGKHCPGVS